MVTGCAFELVQTTVSTKSFIGIHGGGDWIPWGRSLSEAIAFDCLREYLPGRRQHYANVAAEFNQELGPDSIPGWAATQLPEPIGRLLAMPASVDDAADVASQMIDLDVAAIAVRCECILTALDSPLRERLTAAAAREIGMRWEPDVVRWIFDNDLIPPAMLEVLSGQFGCQPDQLVGQDWIVAAQHAAQVTARRPDLGWASDVLGWVAERMGDNDKAVRWYRQSLEGSSHADQSVRFRTHWFPESEHKFAAARLQALHEYWDQTLSDDGYFRLYLESKQQSLRSRATNHWLRVAESAVNEGRWASAYEAYYRAGWDLGSDDLDVYGDLLGNLAEAAQKRRPDR